ncbi:hypothetical protein Pan216_22240 [Planctomycetes bacterium Pan216]|uniref:Uncharacterized protein n=1 Tax=Kolteria novifilia TaxID=2527975 RepID=A0A518B316_9BACT|nr:hypothetical protein Pan216_22240 [Planctomycetes bacterium Pan216]
MGIERRVEFEQGAFPPWSSLCELMAAEGEELQLRMVDNELTFPDETPPETWHEIRVGTSSGMITIRRQDDAVSLLAFGNADQEMQRAWNRLTWGVAKAGDGLIVDETGAVDADAFAERESLGIKPPA